MGFNIEQYEIGGNDSYSNAGGCGVLHPFNKDKRAECEKARAEKKAGSKAPVTSDTALTRGAVCVKGLPVYHLYAYAVTSRDKRTQNRLICKARKEAKIKDDVAPVDAVRDNPLADAQAPLADSSASSSSNSSSRSNRGLYIGIGVGVLAIGIVAIILIKRK